MDFCLKNSNEIMQEDEIQALSSIYGEEWMMEDLNGKEYSINIRSSSGKSVYFQVMLPHTYPLQSKANFIISAPWMNRDEKKYLTSALDNIYSENLGESIIYQWIVQVQDFIDGLGRKQTVESLLSANVLAQVEENSNFFIDEIPPIQHGQTIVDRKSVFQAHLCKIVSVKQIKQVLYALKENKKIVMAKHNVFAYRIARENKPFIQDYDDDGEYKAGSVVLHLLQILDVSDVLVVVTRWYGGVHLGADRFKHYSNAARSLLCDSGFVTKEGTHRAQVTDEGAQCTSSYRDPPSRHK